MDANKTKNSDLYLILSTPPHGDLEPKAVAATFGQTVAEVGMLLRNPIPKIWFAGPDAEDMRSKAKALREVGARVRLVKGASLGALSGRFDLRDFAFADDGMRCTIDEGRTARVPYDWKVICVSCRPAEVGHGPGGSLLQTVREVENRSFGGDATGERDSTARATDPSFIDLYFMSLPRVWRFTIRPGVTSFAGLADRMQPAALGNKAELLKMLAERFAQTAEDARLNDPPPPGPATVGGKALTSVLGSVDPSLKAIEWYDLLSRLVFLSVA